VYFSSLFKYSYGQLTRCLLYIWIKFNPFSFLGLERKQNEHEQNLHKITYIFTPFKHFLTFEQRYKTLEIDRNIPSLKILYLALNIYKCFPLTNSLSYSLVDWSLVIIYNACNLREGIFAKLTFREHFFPSRGVSFPRECL